MNGPLATAGSILNFFNKIGINEPVTAAIVKAINKDKATIKDTLKASSNINEVSPSIIGLLLI